MMTTSILYSQSPPWPLSPNAAGGTDIILHRGIAPITCGVIQSTPANNRWTFAMISLNDAIPTSGRNETTNTDSVFHHDSWLISQIGNVFGVDINETTGAVYITASSNYASGFAEEASVLQYGSIGGSNQTTAAGAVYKIDPVTGQASLFASLPQQSTSAIHVDCIFGEMVSRSNFGVGLGNIVWDEYRNQYFVTNIEDGRIYRLDQNGNILDSYDPFTYDNGAAGISILNELPYGVTVEPGGNRLLFGGVDTHSEYDYSAVTSPGIYSIDLNADGSFAGTVDNSSLPSGANYNNYVGTETLHVQITSNGGALTGFISDLEFDPNGNLLAGLRTGCYQSWFTSDGHGSTTSRIALNGATNLYSDNIVVFDISVQGVNAPEDNYGGVASYTSENGSIIYAASSSDILSEQGPHGIAVWNSATTSAPLDPLGAFSYGLPLSIDPKGIGGDIDIYTEAYISCALSCSISSQNNETCENAADGNFTAIAASTDPAITNFEYSIDGGTNWQANGTFTGLSIGTYTVSVREAGVTGSCQPTCDVVLECVNQSEQFANVTLAGNANDSSSGGSNELRLSGAILAAGSGAGNSNSSLVNNSNSTAVLQFDDMLPVGFTITVSLAKNNANGAATISDGNTAGDFAFNAGNQDELQHVNFTLTQATDQITITRTGGSVWVDGAEYSGTANVSLGLVCDACASPCSIDTDGLTSVSCTGTDAIRLELTPTGTAVGGTYSVSVSGGAATSISPTSGTYGAATIFTLNDNSAGGGDVTITLTDADNFACTREVMVADPGGCLICSIITNSTQSTCNDNGTSSDSSDDYFTIDFNATAVNAGAQYEVVLGANADGTGGTVLATSNYGTAVTVGTATTFAADGTSTYAITIRDATTNTCHQDLTTTSVTSCSNTCELTITENAQSTCNDNGTSSDSSDDYFTIDFNATAVNAGAQYEVVLGANADGTGGTVLATSNYGTAVTVGTSTTFAADGTSTYAITVRDATTNTCHQDLTTTSVTSCSNTCELTITENAQSTCNDNGTSSGSSDDYFTIDFNATAVNAGAQYEVVLGANADGTGGTVLATSNYGTAVTVGTSTTFAADGTSTYAITIRDATTNTCHQDLTTTSVTSCSNTCELTITENAQSTCNDNGTSSDSSDDYFTIDFNATAVNAGAQYEVVLGANADGTGGTVLATSNYGTAVTVGTSTTFAADGTSTYAITVRDATTNTCHQDLTTTSVTSCSNTCELTITENAQSTCNDNGTSSDSSDDYFTIDFNATAINAGAQYEVVLGANADGTGGTVLATSNYGTAVTVGTSTTFAADGTSTYAITVRDATTNTCHQDLTTTSVTSCSNTCELTITENAQSTCNDNGTSSDSSDDYFTIDFNATAVNAGAQYEVVLGANADGTGGTVLATSNYGTAVTVGTSTTFAADGTSTYAITVRDATTNTCHQDLTTTSVTSCSNTCELTITENAQSTCNDNGTSSDSSDDYFTIDFNATAVNAGAQYEVVLGANADGTGGTVLATSNYGTAVTVGTATTFAADGTSTYAITVRDATTNTCHQDLTTTSVTSCSNTCELTITENAQSTCNDNGTSSDSSDDYFAIDFNATAINASAQYEVVLGANADGTGGTVLATSNYGTAVTVGTATTFAADGTSTYAITVRDATTNTCHQDLTTTSVISCSNTCELTITENAQSTCNDNGTSSDSSDDYFTIDFNATAVNAGAQYEVVLGANADGTGGTVLATSNYGTAVTVGTATTFAADGTSTYAITVRDATTNTCHQDLTTTSVTSCSNTCELTITENAQSTCNDNGTSSDSSDDYFTIDFNATAVNAGAQYEVVLGANADGTGGTVLATSNYGTSVTVGTATTFAADGTSTYAITVRDATTNTCHQDVTTTSVTSCSNTCELTITENAQSTCNDNGTSSDSSDDYFTIDFNATAVNAGAQYEVVLGANADGTGGTVLATSNYGTSVTVGTATTFAADGTSTYAITVRDATTNTCHQDLTTTSVTSCSNTCELTITENAQSTCNDNGTSSDSSDDYFTIDFNATAINAGAQYEVVLGANADGTGGTVLATSNYGTAVTVGTATTFAADGTSTYAITVRDATTNTCHQDLTTTSVTSCSNTCELTITENAQSTCNDNGTSSDSSDDYFTIDFNATAVNAGAQYEVVLGANADGTGGTVLATSNYGTAVTVGTATTFAADGTSTYAITVRDATTNTCHQDLTTTVMASCFSCPTLFCLPVEMIRIQR